VECRAQVLTDLDDIALELAEGNKKLDPSPLYFDVKTMVSHRFSIQQRA
jgi:hypothetical protein